MRTKRHRTGGLQLAVTGFIVFNKFGDVWMGSHSKERLQKFIEQQPQLKLEPEIHPISSRLDDVRIIKPEQLKERHADAVEAIPTPPRRGHKKRRTLGASAIEKDD